MPAITFDPNDPNAIVIIYPTGGYGNFLYYLLSTFLDNTVKVDQSNFAFNPAGNSHSVNKYIETFALGEAYYKKTLKTFSYNYKVLDPSIVDQLNTGKKFIILGDVGNLGDNITFVRKYFPKATILRVYNETFDEKLVVWANCLKKAYRNLDDPVYKDSLHTVNGIAKFSNKPVSEITDTDAIDCALDFFKNDFDIYGRFFTKPHPDAINIPASQFFTVDRLQTLCSQLATQFNSSIINQDRLVPLLDNFIKCQQNFKLLTTETNTLAGQAVHKWRSK